MPKLHLKPTPVEERERARRKAHRAATRAARRRDRPDHDAIRAELEEARFREKMRDALEDDERLGGIDARLNDYFHIPDRWSRDKHDAADPQYMDDDEYAEWVREGMWKKKHAREYEEQAKRVAERAARRVREKEIKAEATRLESLVREREERRRRDKQKQHEEEYRQQYEQRWKVLLDPRARDLGQLTLGDIPWPVFSAHFAKRSGLRVSDITPEAITAFISPDADDITTSVKGEDVARQVRDKLRETLLRFHPDKFEGRFMHRVAPSDVESIREAVGQVARVLNTLMNGQS